MPQDILLDSGDWDLDIANGDFVVGESTLQHQKDILLAHKSEYKAVPTLGVGIVNYLDDDDGSVSGASDMLREINKQFSADGMKVTELTVNDIKANY